MRRWSGFLILAMLFPSLAAADYYRNSAGVGFGITGLSGGTPPWFTLSPEYSLTLGTRISGNWYLDATLSNYNIYDDTLAHSEFRFGSRKEHRTRAFRGVDIGLEFRHRTAILADRLFLATGLGGGISVWKMTDKDGTTLRTFGERGDPTDFSATEIFLQTVLGTEIIVKERWRLGLDCRARFLIGAGAEFASIVEKNRPVWRLSAGLHLSCLLGVETGWKVSTKDKLAVGEEVDITARWREDIPTDTLSTMSPGSPDNSARIIDRSRSRDIAGKFRRGSIDGPVDQWNWPIDTDRDGFPNYIDSCPYSPAGAVVDEHGCPLDGDRDGVPDGLDLCPDSDSGIAVDENGCIDRKLLNQPWVLAVRYYEGSFEVDPWNLEKLKGVARTLSKLRDILIEINGYADDFQTEYENLELSQKRANRVRDYLVSFGTPRDMLKAIGHGSIWPQYDQAKIYQALPNRRVILRFKSPRLKSE